MKNESAKHRSDQFAVRLANGRKEKGDPKAAFASCKSVLEYRFRAIA
jgi:hypothetical protein